MCDIRLIHPFRCLISGPSSSGKTSLLKNILLNKNSFINSKKPIKITYFYYTTWQPIYDEMVEEGLVDIFKKQNISIKEFNNEASPHVDEGGSLFIIDDSINDKKNGDLCEIFTTLSHHRNASIIFITQNLFAKMLDFRTISLNCQYIFLMKSPRDTLQLNAFARQMFPGNSKFVRESYQKATEKPYSYILFSAHQETEDHLRILSNLFDSNSPPIAYLPKDYY
jgi:hypothetical protein